VLAALLAVGQGLAREPEGKAAVDALYQRARALRLAGKWQEATRMYEKVVEKAREVFGPDHINTSTLTLNLAGMYQEMGLYRKAEPLYAGTVKALEASKGKDDLDVATALNNLALLYQAMGRCARAESLFERSGKIREAKLGKDHLAVAQSLNNLASLYQDMGLYAKAEARYRRALTIREGKLGKDHLDVAITLNDLASLCQAMHQYDKAEVWFKRTLKIREARLDSNHPDIAAALNNLGLLYRDMGQPARASDLFERSGRIWQARLGEDHPYVATSLNNQALVHADLGQHARAEQLYLRGLKIREGRLGNDHPLVARSLEHLALLYGRTGKANKATRLFDRARRIARRHIAAILPALTGSDKAAFFAGTPARSKLEMALSLALASKDEELLARSASWLLNGKGMDQEGLASALLLVRDSDDADLGKVAGQLLAVREQLARLMLSQPPPGQEKHYLQRSDELTVQEQELSKQLRQAGSKAAVPWVEPADLRKALPAGVAFIDVAHFRLFDFKAKPEKAWRPPHCAAWVTVKNGPVRLVDLGPAEQIDAAIKRFREALHSAGKHIKQHGEEKSEQVLREPLEALSRLVLHPLLPHAGTATRWLVSPDGNLWLIPFEALLLKDGRYAVEKYQISYASSGRYVLPPVPVNVKRSAPLVLADPDFDLVPDRARTTRSPAPVEEESRSLLTTLRLGSVRRLEGTAAEARAIAPSLQAYARAAPRVCLRERALESVFKRTRNPRVLVLSTHGFFLPDQETPRDDRGGVDKVGPGKKWENPLLRCGLLLAGCNNAAKVGDGDDGVLTGLEVVGTDLRGCDLVVLSACDTGLGEVQSGEGVAGLRQAFQLAGAQAVVSTLWQVPDKQSARLMALFFQNLSKGQSKAEALRAAKLKIVEERREDFAAAHPFFWAAFTLTGQP
jgi:CHAT domain-containing protein/Tfp pilus assembly protein PilF